MSKSTLLASALAVLAAVSACTVHDTNAPSVTGPSVFATSVAITATPDSINQDGGSQSSIQVVVRDENGRPESNQVLRLDVLVDGSQVDFGTLSARTIVTGSDGVARAIYTAPPASPSGSIIGTCKTVNTPGTLAGGCITVTATPSSSNFQTAQTQSVEIHLTPIGIILPVGAVPVAAFTTSTPVSLNVPTFFDASTSCAVPLVNGACNPGGTIPTSIVQYAWTFGDGASASGRTVSHTYTSAGTFSAMLTVTNSSLLSASTSQALTVGASATPTGDWVFSPAAPAVGDTVSFNGDGVQPAPGRTLVQFSWNFGDGGTASGFQATHTFNAAGAYNVTLSVLDDVGQKKVISKSVSVGTGVPTASFTFAVTNAAAHRITVDGSGSTAAGNSTIATYAWSWGDGNSDLPSAATVASHDYAAAGTYTVTLTTKDTLGRSGTTSQSVTVP